MTYEEAGRRLDNDVQALRDMIASCMASVEDLDQRVRKLENSDPPPQEIDWDEEHAKLLKECLGFAAGTTGGSGGDLSIVATLEDSGVGSLRNYLEDDAPQIIVFEIEGQINLRSPIRPGPNKTVWGRKYDGSTAQIHIHAQNDKAAFQCRYEDNLILCNLSGDANYGRNDDAPDWVQIWEGRRNIWIHHCEMLGDGSDRMDGAVDSYGECTISNSIIEDWNKANLIRNGGKATFYNTEWINCLQRTPKVDNAYAALHFCTGYIDHMAVDNGGTIYIQSVSNINGRFYGDLPSPTQSRGIREY